MFFYSSLIVPYGFHLVLYCTCQLLHHHVCFQRLCDVVGLLAVSSFRLGNVINIQFRLGNFVECQLVFLLPVLQPFILFSMICGIAKGCVVIASQCLQFRFECTFLLLESLILIPYIFIIESIGIGVLQQLACHIHQECIFVEAHYRLYAVAYQVVYLLIFHKLTRLHGIEKEIFAQFRRQVRLYYLADSLLVKRLLFRWSMCAIRIRVAAYVKGNVFHRLAIEYLVSPSKFIFSKPVCHNAFKLHFKYNSFARYVLYSRVEQLTKVCLSIDIQAV